MPKIEVTFDLLNPDLRTWRRQLQDQFTCQSHLVQKLDGYCPCPNTHSHAHAHTHTHWTYRCIRSTVQFTSVQFIWVMCRNLYATHRQRAAAVKWQWYLTGLDWVDAERRIRLVVGHLFASHLFTQQVLLYRGQLLTGRTQAPSSVARPRRRTRTTPASQNNRQRCYSWLHTADTTYR